MSMSSSVNQTLPRPRNPAPTFTVRQETATLAVEPGQQWNGGTALSHVRCDGVGRRLPVAHALDPKSVVVHFNGRTLTRTKDYEVSTPYGTLSLAPDTTLKPTDEVHVDYTYSHRRMDSVVRRADGEPVVREGQPHLTTPRPPELEPSDHLVGNYFLNYFDGVDDAEFFPAQETADQRHTATSQGLVPETLAKLRSGEPVHIVFWGDSITEGGDASTPEQRFTAQFQRGLRDRYPDAPLTVEVAAVGGSQSRQWLYPDRFEHPTRAPECDFQRVVRGRPDLVVVEFFNDVWMDQQRQVNEAYSDILKRLHGHNAEVILVSPSFTMPQKMGTDDPRTAETRPYVHALRTFAAEHRVALADASARWEHLWREGVPYVTLLHNGINHPDDRGHTIFAEEILKCFEIELRNGR